MAYDPQANRRRPRPDADQPAPVDALLGDEPAAGSGPAARGPVLDYPPPTPAVTPEPADPPPDGLLLSTGLAAAGGALVTALVARHFWIRHRRRTNAADDS